MPTSHPERFPHQALGEVAVDRPGHDPAADDHAEPRGGSTVVGCLQREVASFLPAARAQRLFELPGVGEPGLPGKASACWVRCRGERGPWRDAH